MFLKSNGFSGKNKGSNKQNMVIHIILLISQFIIALKWLIIKYSTLLVLENQLIELYLFCKT